MNRSSTKTSRAGDWLQISLAGFLTFLLGSNVLVAVYAMNPKVGSALYYVGPICIAANLIGLAVAVGCLGVACSIWARRLLRRGNATA